MMVARRPDANQRHPALCWIEKHHITRAQAAEMLGVNPSYLNQVLDRWRGTSKQYAKLFHDVFGIPYDDLVDIPVRLDAKTFRKRGRK